MRLKIFSFLICAAVFLSGCASFRNHEVADVNKLPDISQYSSRPSVFIESHYYRGEPASAKSEILVNKGDIHELIGKCLDNAGVFSKYSFNDVDKATFDYSINIDIYNHGNEALAAVSGFITGFTFGLIPGAATDNYTIRLKLSDKSGALISEITNKDSITTWVGLLFVPMMNNTPKKAFNSTLDNQLRAALKELVESGKLKYSFLDVYRRVYTT